ncbi:unnamed protein product [Urochloa humidicola]
MAWFIYDLCVLWCFVLRCKSFSQRDSEDWLFDEEDYMLLQGNNITGISLSKPRNKFKRWKKAGKESEMDEHGSSGERMHQ